MANCTIDWFLRWPRDALVAVADHFLSSFNIVCTDSIKKQLVQCMGSVHDGVAEYCSQYFQKYRRSTHVTPKSYLSFLNDYKEIYSHKLNEIESMAKRMNDGLTRLVEAEKAVIVMKEELSVKEQELDFANRKADQVLQEVAIKKGAAEIVRQQVQKVKDTAQTLVDEINRDKLQANAELENAKPALIVSSLDIGTVQRFDEIILGSRRSFTNHHTKRYCSCTSIIPSTAIDSPNDGLCADSIRTSIEKSYSNRFGIARSRTKLGKFVEGNSMS